MRTTPQSTVVDERFHFGPALFLEDGVNSDAKRPALFLEDGVNSDAKSEQLDS
jgi:hypothetical protein